MDTTLTRSPRFAAQLDAHGAVPALIDADGEVSYAELAAEVDRAQALLGTDRRLVLLVGRNSRATIVWYLACLAGRHPVGLLTDERPEHLGAWIDRLDPDVVIDTGRHPALLERRPVTIHDFDPELALLLATSGSTGAPKLVRLSVANLEANASAIAEALAIRPDDRAMLNLPLAYTYGLSIVHSNLDAGAAVVLTSASVLDACFWRLFRAASATSLAGVPHTFELLARVDDWHTEPTLRYVTQAGGRLEPDRVRELARTGQRHGWTFHVMYGQTEATARMSVLAPELAEQYPTSIGAPIRGGAFRIDDVPEATEPGVGELVYQGPNVMMGYASEPADLALGALVDELRTGDLAKIGDGGLIEICGRRARFAKVVGLRIDLDYLEAQLEDRGIEALCCEYDHRLAVVAVGDDPDRVRIMAAESAGLPPACVVAETATALPRTAAGKPDRAAAAAQFSTATPSTPVADVRDIFASILHVADPPPTASFVDLGGDSLSYVAMSVALEAALGHLPRDWHRLSIEDLERHARPARQRRWRAIETGVALRALAIFAIVGTHVGLFTVRGGAHLLLAIVGYNVARFQLASPDHRVRVCRVLRSTARIAVPSILWIGVLAFVVRPDVFSTANVLLLNNLLGADAMSPRWRYWFIEAIVVLLLASAALCASRRFTQIEQRHPFGVALVLLAPALAVRFGALPFEPDLRIFSPLFVAWLFVLGWAIARCTRVRQRVLISAVATLATVGYFDSLLRTAIVLGGLLALVWIPTVRVPATLAPTIGVLAASSLMIYLTHWTVNAQIRSWGPIVGLVAALAVGAALWKAVSIVSGWPTGLAVAYRARQRRRTRVRPQSAGGD